MGKKKTMGLRAKKVSDMLDMYIEHSKRLRRENTLHGYFSMGRHILQAFGERDMCSITHRDVFLWHEDLSLRIPRSADAALSLLRCIYRFSVSFEIVSPHQNPCLHIKRNKLKIRTRFLTLAELRVLFQSIDIFEKQMIEKIQKSNRLKKSHEKRIVLLKNVCIAIRMLLYTGCRRGEILSSKWDHLSKFEGKSALWLPTTKTRPRIVSLPDIAMKELVTLKQLQRSCKELADCEWIFPSPKSIKKHIRSIQSPWKKIREIASLQPIWMHDLRRTYASQAILAGCDFSDIAAQLGHESDHITRKFYANIVVPPGAKIVAEKVGQRFEDIFDKR